MKRTLGRLGAVTWIGIFFTLAIANAHGAELAAALNNLALALQPPPTPVPPPVVAMSVSHSAAAGGSPALVFLVLAGLLLGGGALCVWLWRRARIHLLTEEAE
ncbi:MAG TPA: hypothetical protein PKH77_09720 [Anaerolineae bacterium]|nr:hypothetical protein [Anaerolineae bacterium]